MLWQSRLVGDSIISYFTTVPSLIVPRRVDTSILYGVCPSLYLCQSKALTVPKVPK